MSHLKYNFQGIVGPPTDLKTIQLSLFYGIIFQSLATELDSIEDVTDNPHIDLIVVSPVVDWQSNVEDFNDDELVSAELIRGISEEVEVQM